MSENISNKSKYRNKQSGPRLGSMLFAGMASKTFQQMIKAYNSVVIGALRVNTNSDTKNSSANVVFLFSTAAHSYCANGNFSV